MQDFYVAHGKILLAKKEAQQEIRDIVMVLGVDVHSDEMTINKIFGS